MQDERFVQLTHERVRNLCVGCHHATQSSVQVGDDDAIAFARQPGAEILDLRCQPPFFMQEDETGVAPAWLGPKLNTFHLHVFRDACLDVGVDGSIRECGNGDATREAGCAGADLIQGKRSGG